MLVNAAQFGHQPFVLLFLKNSKYDRWLPAPWLSVTDQACCAADMPGRGFICKLRSTYCFLATVTQNPILDASDTVAFLSPRQSPPFRAMSKLFFFPPLHK